MESLPFELIDLILQHVELEDIARVSHVSRRLRTATECTFKWRGKELIDRLKPFEALPSGGMDLCKALGVFIRQVECLMRREYLYAKVPPDHDEFCTDYNEWSASPDQILHVYMVPVDCSGIPADEPFTYFGDNLGLCRCSGRYPFLCYGAPMKTPIVIKLLEEFSDYPHFGQCPYFYDIRRHEKIELVTGWYIESATDPAIPPSAGKWFGKKVLEALGEGLRVMRTIKPMPDVSPRIRREYIRATQKYVEANIKPAMYERYVELVAEWQSKHVDVKK